MKPKYAIYIAYALLYLIAIRSTTNALGTESSGSNTNDDSHNTNGVLKIDGREFYTVEYIHENFVEHGEKELSDADFWLYSTIVMGTKYKLTLII